MSKSRTVATWLALVAGALGAHRLYLRGARDGWAWLHWLPTLVGGYGVLRMDRLGQDDRLAWLLIPWLGLVLSASMLSAIRYGLTDDARWNARWNDGEPADRGGRLAVFGAIVALAVGATVLIATIAFTSQRVFEAQLASAAGAPVRLADAARSAVPVSTRPR